MQRAVWHVFADPLSAHVVHAHKNHGWNYALANQPVAGFVHLPLDSVESGRALEQVLPIIQVKHRIMPLGILSVVVSRRQPYPQKSRVIKNPAAEFVQAQIAGRRLGADYPGRSRVAITFSLLDFSHSEKEF
jgi:hypothetical protein